MSTYMSPKMRIRGMKPATGTLLERGFERGFETMIRTT
jgi:hypothetical protein